MVSQLTKALKLTRLLGYMSHPARRGGTRRASWPHASCRSTRNRHCRRGDRRRRARRTAASVGGDGHRSQRTVDVADEGRLGALRVEREDRSAWRQRQKRPRPMRSGSIFHSRARRRITLKAARESAIRRREPSQQLPPRMGAEAGSRCPRTSPSSTVFHLATSAGVWFSRYLRRTRPRRARPARGDVPTFVLHRQGSEAAAWSHHDGGATALAGSAGRA